VEKMVASDEDFVERLLQDMKAMGFTPTARITTILDGRKSSTEKQGEGNVVGRTFNYVLSKILVRLQGLIDC
jgi:hypothetical protein